MNLTLQSWYQGKDGQWEDAGCGWSVMSPPLKARATTRPLTSSPPPQEKWWTLLSDKISSCKAPQNRWSTKLWQQTGLISINLLCYQKVVCSLRHPLYSVSGTQSVIFPHPHLPGGYLAEVCNGEAHPSQLLPNRLSQVEAQGTPSPDSNA